jgi:hypothetical protein
MGVLEEMVLMDGAEKLGFKNAKSWVIDGGVGKRWYIHRCFCFAWLLAR